MNEPHTLCRVSDESYRTSCLPAQHRSLYRSHSARHIIAVEYQHSSRHCLLPVVPTPQTAGRVAKLPIGTLAVFVPEDLSLKSKYNQQIRNPARPLLK